MTYDLVDAEERARQHPTTFEIPSVEARRAVRPGDFCKLGFVSAAGRTERMWVKVTNAGDANAYVGTLDNDPLAIPLRCGELVAFEARHILNILRGQP
jgi:hypothetical protein